MDLTYEQMKLLRDIEQGANRRAEKIQEIDNAIIRTKKEQLKIVDNMLGAQVNDALNAGIPKRRINQSLKTSNPTAWKLALERAGIER